MGRATPEKRHKYEEFAEVTKAFANPLRLLILGLLEHGDQTLARDLPGPAQRAPDVLVMDGAIGERDAPAKARGQTARPLVRVHQGDGFVGATVSVGGLLRTQCCYSTSWSHSAPSWG